MAKDRFPRIKNYPKVYLWFSSYDSGVHCNTIETSASAIAKDIVERIMPDLNTDMLGEEDKNNSELKLHIFSEINKLKIGENCYFEFNDSSWMTITLLDPISLESVKDILKRNEKVVTKSKKKS